MLFCNFHKSFDLLELSFCNFNKTFGLKLLQLCKTRWFSVLTFVHVAFLFENAECYQVILSMIIAVVSREAGIGDANCEPPFRWAKKLVPNGGEN